VTTNSHSGKAVDELQTTVNVSDKKIENPDDENHWTFNLEAGRYEVFTTWTASAENTELAVYRVTRTSDLLVTGVDQTVPPAGETFDGVTWEKLGDVELDQGGQVEVAVFAGQEGDVSAEAMCFRPIIEAPQVGGDHWAVKGQDYTLQLDYGAFDYLSWTIDWGDGWTDYLACYETSWSHQYADRGDYTISVTAEGTIESDTFVYDNDNTNNSWTNGYLRPIAVRVIGQGDLIENGEFSQPAVTHQAKWDLFSSVPGWTGSGLGGTGSASIEIQALGGISEDPDPYNQYVELDADQNGPNGGYYPGETGQMEISQLVTTVANETYRLTFAASPRTAEALDNMVKVTVDGAANLQTTNSLPAAEGQDYNGIDYPRVTGNSVVFSASGWKPDAIVFDAQGTSTTVKFEDYSGPYYDDTLGPFIDKVKMYPLGAIVDIDTDSDNDGTIDVFDDPIEADLEELGKVVGVNSGDVDHDGVPDFADGINLFGNLGDNASSTFTELRIEVQPPSSVDEALFKFVYSASDPGGIQRTGEAPFYEYLPAPTNGHLRIWAVDGNAGRDIDTVSNGGDYVAPWDSGSPTDNLYTASELGFDGSNTTTLFLEGILASNSIADQSISVEIDPDGSAGPLGFVASDEVRVTLFEIEMLRGKMDPQSGRGAIGDPDDILEPVDVALDVESSATPVVEIEAASWSNVRRIGSSGPLLGTLDVSGTVTFAVADAVPDNQADPTYVTIRINGDDVSTLPLTRVEESPSLLRPYAAHYTFDGTVDGTAQILDNALEVIAYNPILETDDGSDSICPF